MRYFYQNDSDRTKQFLGAEPLSYKFELINNGITAP